MKLLYFAWVRQKIGLSEEDFALPAGVENVAQLMEALAKRGPGYAEAFRDPKRLRCAVNQNHVPFSAKVSDGDEVAFFPPVTGGAGPSPFTGEVDAAPRSGRGRRRGEPQGRFT